MTKQENLSSGGLVEPEVLHRLIEAFPEGYFPEGLQQRACVTHKQYVELRLQLPLLLAKDVREWLPGVLYDLVISRDRFREEFGDSVIYFLDVSGEDTDCLASADTQDMIRDFADNVLGNQEGELLKAVMFQDLPVAPLMDKMSEPEKHGLMTASREASFDGFTADQNLAILLWLQLVARWSCVDFCRDSVERALVYWYRRCRWANTEAIGKEKEESGRGKGTS